MARDVRNYVGVRWCLVPQDNAYAVIEDPNNMNLSSHVRLALRGMAAAYRAAHWAGLKKDTQGAVLENAYEYAYT